MIWQPTTNILTLCSFSVLDRDPTHPTNEGGGFANVLQQYLIRGIVWSSGNYKLSEQGGGEGGGDWDVDVLIEDGDILHCRLFGSVCLNKADRDISPGYFYADWPIPAWPDVAMLVSSDLHPEPVRLQAVVHLDAWVMTPNKMILIMRLSEYGPMAMWQGMLVPFNVEIAAVVGIEKVDA